MTYGSARYGGTLYGGSTALVDFTPPDEPGDLDWDPEAGLPVGAPTDETVVPEVSFELIGRAGTHLGWLNAGKGWTWRRAVRDVGSASAVMQRTDPLLAELKPTRMLRVRYRGKVVQDALIQPQDEASVAQGEEADQTITLQAPGHGAVLEDLMVGPWSSTSRPASDSQRFSFAHPHYTMTPGWGNAAQLARQDTPTTFWTGLPVKWPAPTAYYIAGGSDSTSDADPGHLYTRRKFTTQTRTYAVCWSGDNFTDMYVDGVRQGETRDFQGFQRVDIRFTAGEHTFAAHWENEQRETTNPTFFLFSLHPIDSAGRLGDPVLVSDSSWMILDRPVNEPGWKVGQIIDYLLDKASARSGNVPTGGNPIYRTWTTLTDTLGETFTTVPDLTISATSSVLQALQQLSETYIDWNMRPGLPFTLDVWNKGSRGSDRAIVFESGYDDPDSPITSLDHTTDPPYATSVFAHYGEAWIRRTKSVPGFYIEKPLEIPNVITKAEAIDTVDKLLDIWGRTRIQYRMGYFRPAYDNTADRPHLNFHASDRLGMPGPDGATDQVQVQSITGTVNDDGTVSFQFEAGDLRYTEEERIFTTMRRMEAGAFGGRTEQATSTRTELPRQLVASEVRPLRFHRPASVTEVESDWDTPEESGRIRAWVATIGATQASDVDVDMYIDGAPSGVTVTVPAGQLTARVHCNVAVEQDADKVSAHCADTGFALVAKAIFE